MKKANEIHESLSKKTAKHEIRFREGNAIGNNRCNMLAYVDARYVQDRLDEATEGYWKNEYKEIKGNLFCGISILLDGEWVIKWDVGVESKFEPVKGEASDSFKRAGVQWGIGRDLYSIGSFTAITDGQSLYNWKPKGWNEDNIGIPEDTTLAPHNRPTKETMTSIEKLYAEVLQLNVLDDNQKVWMDTALDMYNDKMLHKNKAEQMRNAMQTVLNKHKIQGDS